MKAKEKFENKIDEVFKMLHLSDATIAKEMIKIAAENYRKERAEEIKASNSERFLKRFYGEPLKQIETITTNDKPSEYGC